MPVRRDHVAEALASLPPTLDKPNWRALATASMAQIQAIEDAAIAVILQRAYPDAEGAQLDQIGKLVGQPRDGRDDADYRRVIGAKIAVNGSQGGREDLIRVARLTLLDSSVRVRLEAYLLPGGDQAMTLEGEVSHAAAANVLAFAKLAAQAGVRVIVESWPSGAAEAFRLDDEEPGLGFDEPRSIDLAGLTTFDSIICLHPDYAADPVTLEFVADMGGPTPADGVLDESGYPAIVFTFQNSTTTIADLEAAIRHASNYMFVGQAASTPGAMNDSDDDFAAEPFGDGVQGGVLATSMDGRETYPP